MKNKSGAAIMEIAAAVVGLIVYNGFVLLIFREKGDAYWSAYIFSMLAIAVQAIVPIVTSQKSSRMSDALLGFSLLKSGMIYLAVQIIFGLIVMAVRTFPVTWAVVIQMILLAVYVIMVISAIVADHHVEEVNKKTAERTFFVKALRADLAVQKSRVSDAEVTAALDKLAEKLKYADPTSSDLLAKIEDQISDTMEQLKAEIAGGGDKKQILQLIHLLDLRIDERNIKCRLLK